MTRTRAAAPARALAQLALPMSSGWSRSMIVVPLAGGGSLVHSPTWLGDDTFAKVEAHGEPRVLFAPNHFHHMSLARFRERWPSARAVAGEAALPRLRAKGHASVEHVASVASELRTGARAHALECAGTKAGETFLSLEDDDGARTWIACDAFFNVTTPVTGMVGAILRTLKTTPGLCIGQTFLWVALKDRAAYLAWLLDALARERPTRLFVSHGEPLEAPDLHERLATLARSRLL